MAKQPVSLLGTAWVVARTGLARNTVLDAAAAGRIPSATKLLGVWRFDPAQIEAWIEAGRPTPSQTTEPKDDCYPSRAAPKPDRQRAEAVPSAIPPLVVIFPNAAHRGINDRPAEKPARATATRRRRTKKAAVPR